MPKPKQAAGTVLAQEDVQYLLEATNYSEDEIRYKI
jgi:hypothetical protein